MESYTTLIKAGLIKKGHIVLIDNQPCKIVDYDISKPGKHGHCKIVLTGINIFTNKKKETMSATHSNMDEVNV